MKKEWGKLSLIFLFLVALIGTLMRAAGIVNTPFEYTHLLHAHSHVAFQGWVYLILMLLLTRLFLDEDQVEKGRYPLQFKLTVLIVVGILVSFALQGYGLYSIIFSTLFQALNYWFIFRFLKDSRRSKAYSEKAVSIRLIRTGLLFGLLSTLLPYAVGILSAKDLNGTEAYRSLVYTFLHLQYNGWFLFVVLGLFFDFLDKRSVRYQQKLAKLFYWLMTLAVIPATTLSLLGMEFINDLMPMAYVSALLTAGSFLVFLLLLPRNLLASLKDEHPWFKLFFYGFLATFLVKTFLMSLSVLPVFIAYAAYNKFIIIAYLHLSLIGSISFLLLALMFENKWLSLNMPIKLGSIFLVSGFAITELLLVFAGLGIYYDQISLIAGSSLMALGILLMIISGNQNKIQHGKI